MEGLAKSAEQAQPVVIQHSASTGTIAAPTESIPMEMYRYFQVDPVNSGKDSIRELKSVYNWAKRDSESMGDSFMKIRNLALKLGNSGVERMHTKMYNWIRVSGVVEELSGEREAQIARQIKKHETKAAEIKSKLQSELKSIEKTKEKERNELKKMHAKEIEQLKKLRKAYEYGGR